MSETQVLESDQVFATREEGVAFVRRQLAAELSAAIRGARSGAEIGRAMSTKWNATRIKVRVSPYTGGVYLCKRPVDVDILPGIADHHWLKTDRHEAGMGGLCDIPGQGCSDVPYSATTTKSHIGQSDQLNASCSSVTDVDPDCVDSMIAPGQPTGIWTARNDCQTFAARVLVVCRRK